MFGTGISNTGCILDLAVMNGFIQKSGSWFSYNDEKIGQGRDKAIEFLKSNPEIAAKLEAAVKEKLVAKPKNDEETAE